MPLSDQQQFEAGLRAVMQGLITSDCLLAAVDQWRQSGHVGQSLEDVIVAQSVLSDEVRRAIAQLFIDAELPGNQRLSTNDVSAIQNQIATPATAHRPIDAEDVARLKKLLQEESGDDDIATSDSMAATDLFDSQQTKSILSTGDEVEIAVADDATGRPARTDANRFRLLDQVAVGGLGEIYRADDTQLRRTVAVKKIRKKHSDLQIARDKFTLEAEVTGQLEHPGIVPVYALGVDQNRQPYYAMRFITGENLAQRIAAFHSDLTPTQLFDGLPLRQLLRRFLDICNAIEYAHARGVVHRDLKPANIMVGDHGETLVVDWGLAKVMSSAAEVGFSSIPASSGSQAGLRLSGSAGMTILGSFLGTVRYAPPEQLLGLIEEVDARSDVYSLGAILYEILCGRAPLESSLRDPQSAYAALRDGQVITARSINPSAPAPLDAICKMAMAFDSRSRYASARELAEDVERWLADESVRAYRGSEPISERAGRWLRKHRSWTLAIGSALLLITVGAIIASGLINRARVSEQVARTHAQEFKSDAVARYRAAKTAIDNLVERSESLKDYPNTHGLQQQLLEEAAGIFQSLGQSASDDPELQIERIRATVRLGDVYHMVQALKNDATNHDPDHDPYTQYERALQLANEALTARSSNVLAPDMRLAVELEAGRVMSRLALAKDLDGELLMARDAYRKAIATLSDLERAHPRSIDVAGNLAIALGNSAMNEERAGQSATALKLFEQSRLRFEKVGISEQALYALSSVRMQEAYARMLRSAGRHADATALFSQVRTSLARLLASDPKNWRYREAEASLMVSWATTCRVHGDFVAALEMLRAARNNYDELRRERPDSLDYQRGYAIARLDEGLVQLEMGERASATEALSQAYALFEDLLRGYSWLDELRLQAALAKDASAESLLSEDQPISDANAVLAQQLFDDAQAIMNELCAPAQEGNESAFHYPMLATLARFQSHQARFLQMIKQETRAGQQFTAALETLEKICAEESQSTQYRSDLAHVCWHAGLFYYEQGDVEQARKLFVRSRELWRSLLVDDKTPLNQYYLARLLLHCPDDTLRDRAQAEQLLQLCCQAVPTNAVFARDLAEVR